MQIFRSYSFQFVFVIFFTFFILSPVNAADLEDVIFLQGAFKNVANKNACAIFSGNVNSPENAPNDGVHDDAHYLVQSSIGWPAPATVGWIKPGAAGLPGEPANAAEALAHEGYQYLKAVQDIFLSYYQNEDPTNPESIYLAFDYFITEGNNRIINPRGEQISIDGDLFDPDALFDEVKSDKAKQCFFEAFNINPYLTYPMDENVSIDIRSLLLDVPYYQSAALLMKGNLALERAFAVRFFEELRPSGTVINDELEKLGWNIAMDNFSEQNEEGAWKHFNEATRVWLDVFASPIQRAYLLEFAPFRTLDYRDHPKFMNTATPEGLTDAEWPPVVYEGYKDVAAMMRALAQRARVVHEVARRLVLKLERTQATELVEEHVQQIALEEGMIMSFFFPDGLPEDHEIKYPGLAESFLALRDAATQLGQLREAATNPRLNPLGFDRDVLFIRSVEPGSPDRTLYTYNWLESQLFDNGGNPINVLGTSYKNDEEAKETRKKFEFKAAQYLSEFDNIEDEYDQQLIAICGPDPGNPYKPNLENPLEGGGLLEQQNANVEIALNAIERVQRLMENVRTRIEIEQDRVAEVNGVSDKRIRIINETTGKVAQITEEIAEIQGEMSIASGISSAVSTLATGDWKNTIFGGGGPAVAAAAQAANGFIQAQMQKRIGKKQAAIVKLQGEQQAKFEYLSQQINDINSEAQVKSMFLELRTLEIDMFDAELRYAQEVKRLAQLYNEIENKVMRRDRSLDRMTRRSFADPTYRIEVTSTALKAEDSFQVAQTWVYFLAKALAYKWPTGKSDLNMTFQDIMMARTAERLESLVNNMRTYNMTQQGNPGAAYFYWNYSLRKEYLGMTFDKTEPDGQVQTAVEQFQAFLASLRNDPANIVQVDNVSYLAIPFSTVKFDIPDDISGGAYIQDSEGEMHQASATPIFQTGVWDSKIDWVQVNVIGNNIYTNPQTMEVFLWYGGSGFVRTRDYFTDPDNPGEQMDFLVFSNPAYTFGYIPGGRGFSWDVLPYIRQKMTAKLVTDVRNIPDVVFKNEAFRERPVASTDWRLLIPMNGTSLENIRDIEINVLYTARTRP